MENSPSQKPNQKEEGKSLENSSDDKQNQLPTGQKIQKSGEASDTEFNSMPKGKTQLTSQNPDEDEQELTPEHLEHFNKICSDATSLMHAYKNQSEELKEQISNMVSVYAKNAEPGSAVPVDKIMEVTKEYETGMREANEEYHQLAANLKAEEQERDQMMLQIQDCFAKLELMEHRLKAKKLGQKPQASVLEKKETKAHNQNQNSTETLQEKSGSQAHQQQNLKA